MFINEIDGKKLKKPLEVTMEINDDDMLENIRYKTEEELTPEEETFLIKEAIKKIATAHLPCVGVSNGCAND